MSRLDDSLRWAEPLLSYLGVMNAETRVAWRERGLRNMNKKLSWTHTAAQLNIAFALVQPIDRGTAKSLLVSSKLGGSCSNLACSKLNSRESDAQEWIHRL